MDNLNMKIEATLDTENLFKDSVTMLCKHFKVNVTIDDGKLQYTEEDGCPIKYINISDYVDIKIK